MHHIRPARPAEAAAISSLAFRSKAHWDYTPDQLAVFREELTLAPEQVERDGTHVLEWQGDVVGFYSLAPFDAPSALELGHLFVDPDHLGAGFYRALGAVFVRDTPSSIPGRTLPLFSVDLLET